MQQQEAEHQGEQSHRFDNTDDDEVVGRALSGFTQSICGGRGHLALEKGGQADGQTRKDTGEHSQQRVTAALHSAADEVHQQEAIDGLGQGSTGESHHDKGGGLAVDVAFFLRADSSLCGKAGTECRAHGGQAQSARHTNKCDIHNCIRTIGDLAKTDPDFLNRRLGKNGIALWQYANGNDRSRVMNADFVSPVKSVGHGITTIEDLENDEQVWPVFLELTQDIGHKLRVHKKCADGVAIHIRDNTLFSKQWQTALDMPTQSPMLIAKAAFALFEKRYDWRNPIRSVTIQAINLVPQDTPRQVDLFMNIEKIEKAERLDQCIETSRQRFGKNSIRNGILFQNLRMPSEKPEITMPTGVLC